MTKVKSGERHHAQKQKRQTDRRAHLHNPADRGVGRLVKGRASSGEGREGGEGSCQGVGEDGGGGS